MRIVFIVLTVMFEKKIETIFELFVLHSWVTNEVKTS